MPLDPSIPLKAQVPQSNPLQMALQVAQFRLANTNGLAMQQQLDANNAASEAFKQSTDENGNTDYNKFRGIMAGGAGAYNLPQINNSILDAQQKQQTLSKDQFDLGMKHLDWVSKTGAMIASDPNATPADVLHAVSLGVKNKLIPYDAAMQALSDMPGPNSPPGALQAWGARHAAQAAGAAEQLKIMTPETGSVGTGGGTQFYNKDKLTGQVTPTQYVGNTLSPGERIAQVQSYNDEKGQPSTKSAAQVAQEQGQGDLVTGGAPGLPTGNAGLPTGNGRYPGTQPQQPTNGGFNPTGAPMGAAGIAEDAGKRYGALQAAAGQAKPMMQTYDLANQAVQGAIAAGKGAGPIASAGGVIQTVLGAFGQKPTGDSVKDYQLAVSYLNSAADQAAQSLGLSGSDARVAAAKAGQPDPNNMNLPALQESIAHAKGLQQALLDRQQATTNFLTQNGNNTGQLPQFEAKWNQAFNPDVSYIRSLPTPEAQRAATQKLKAAGKLDELEKGYKAMKAIGAF